MHLSLPIHDLQYLLCFFLWCSLIANADGKLRIWKSQGGPKVSKNEEVSCDSLCQVLGTQWGDCDKAFLKESTYEVCRHRTTQQLSRSMLRVLKWFTYFLSEWRSDPITPLSSMHFEFGTSVIVPWDKSFIFNLKKIGKVLWLSNHFSNTCSLSVQSQLCVTLADLKDK